MSGEDIVNDLYKHQTLFLHYARRLTNNEADAEDLVQRAYMKVLTSTTMEDTNPKGYMMTTIRNGFLDAVKRKKRHRIVDIPVEELNHITEPIQTEELTDAVRNALTSIPENLRPLVNDFSEGMKYRDIAAKRGTNISTISRKLSYAFGLLKVQLASYVGQPAEKVA